MLADCICPLLPMGMWVKPMVPCQVVCPLTSAFKEILELPAFGAPVRGHKSKQRRSERRKNRAGRARVRQRAPSARGVRRSGRRPQGALATPPSSPSDYHYSPWLPWSGAIQPSPRRSSGQGRERLTRFVTLFLFHRTILVTNIYRAPTCTYHVQGTGEQVWR